MANVVGVRFKDAGKVYYFDPAGLDVKQGDFVIVETARGMECGEVSMSSREIPDAQIVKPLKQIIRKATDEDIKKLNENRLKEKDAFQICSEKILAHGLDMKLVDVEYTFDNNKILFYFTADGRVDFRELVKDLASVFRTRIELRQIGVRDEAKMLGGLGICGQTFCCSRFLGDFQPVSIKMAKEQGLSLNPVKISGTCGRLMCCLKYEQDAYEELLKITPRIGAHINTPEGPGTVQEYNLISGVVKVRLDSNPEAVATGFSRDELGFGEGIKGPEKKVFEQKSPALEEPDDQKRQQKLKQQKNPKKTQIKQQQNKEANPQPKSQQEKGKDNTKSGKRPQRNRLSNKNKRKNKPDA